MPHGAKEGSAPTTTVGYFGGRIPGKSIRIRLIESDDPNSNVRTFFNRDSNVGLRFGPVPEDPLHKEVCASGVGDVEIEFVSDSGMVVVAEGGSLGITLGRPFKPDLFTARGSRDDVPDLHDGTQAWESDLVIEYQCRRTLIPGQDLLA